MQLAVDAPRWIAGRPHVPGREDVMLDVVVVESRMPEEITSTLQRRGHNVDRIGAYDHTMGHLHVIQVDRARGTLAGASDPRADSLALGI